jgi:hypothetical protein
VLARSDGSGLAPRSAEGLDWLAGATEGGKANMRAAQQGKEALAAYQASAEWDPRCSPRPTHAALAYDWSWLMTVVGKANAGPGDGALTTTWPTTRQNLGLRPGPDHRTGPDPARRRGPDGARVAR